MNINELQYEIKAINKEFNILNAKIIALKKLIDDLCVVN